MKRNQKYSLLLPLTLGVLTLIGAGKSNFKSSKVPIPEMDVAESRSQVAVMSQAAALSISSSSLNGGGAIGATSTNYDMGSSAGQSVAGRAGSASFDLDIGFWTTDGTPQQCCLIASTGDVNTDGNLTSADIIFMVNYVFKGGATPNPCEAAADVNCDGNVTSADVIYMVNFVFKGGTPPCNVCPMVCSGAWVC